jgi:aspartate kinase
MKVIKVGGGCLNGKKTIARIVDLIAARGRGHIFVVSALNGITDFLIESMDAVLADEANIQPIISRLKARHVLVAHHLIRRPKEAKGFSQDLSKTLRKLERLFYGLNFTGKISPRLKDAIVSFGERFSAQLLTAILNSRGIPTSYHMPHKIGMLTDGKYGDATANIPATTRNFKKSLQPVLGEKKILFIPGFFGVSKNEDITTFGRGGSDYSAGVVAAAIKADILEIWKDVDGFMSADPKLVPCAELIPVLSYEEASELAYFGARILHPRSVEPVRTRKLNIAIKNTLNPEAEGSLITARSPRLKTVIKSVAHDCNIGILKVHAAGVGARPGILAEVATCITDSEINIKAVVTSQTCISLLLAGQDLVPGVAALKTLRPKPFRRLEQVTDIALISIVGEGLITQKGIAADCFSAVARAGVNVEMISFGPSRAALYFLTKKKNLKQAVNAIHATFFTCS